MKQTTLQTEIPNLIILQKKSEDNKKIQSMLDNIYIKPNKRYACFAEAQKFAKSLSLKTRKEWRSYINGNMPEVKGVAKKYQDFVEQLDNWVDYETFIKQKMKESTFKVPYETPVPIVYRNVINSEIYTNYPKPLQEYYLELCDYHKFNSCKSFLGTEHLRELAKKFNANFVSNLSFNSNFVFNLSFNASFVSNLFNCVDIISICVLDLLLLLLLLLLIIIL